MRLTQRGMLWWVDFRMPDGKRRRLSTGETDKAAAEKAAKSIVTQAMSDNVVSTLGDALNRHFKEHWANMKCASVIRHTVAVLTREIGATPLRDVTYSMLRGYCERLKNEGLKPATINRRMSAVSVALRECARRDGFALFDLPYFEENNRRERYLTDAEEAQLDNWFKRKAGADTYDTPGTGEWVFMRALFPVLLDTGMRFSEAFIATEKRGVLRLRHGDTKSGKARSIPLTRRAAAAWRILVASPPYRALKDDPNAWAWCDHRWKQAVTACGCPDVTLHILRHTCASRLIQRKVDIYTVSKWLGHSSVKVTERYAHLAPDALSNALAALQGGPAGVPVEEPSRDTQRLHSRDELYPSVAHADRADR